MPNLKILSIHNLKMIISSAYIFFNSRRTIPLLYQLYTPKNGYAKKDTGSISMIGGAMKKKKMAKGGPMIEKKVLPVETDPEKLVKYVCGSNIYKTGDDVEIKPDSEYPDWLWNIRLGPPLSLEEMDPNSKEYYLRLRKIGMKRNNRLAQLRKF